MEKYLLKQPNNASIHFVALKMEPTIVIGKIEVGEKIIWELTNDGNDDYVNGIESEGKTFSFCLKSNLNYVFRCEIFHNALDPTNEVYYFKNIDKEYVPLEYFDNVDLDCVFPERFNKYF